MTDFVAFHLDDAHDPSNGASNPFHENGGAPGATYVAGAAGASPAPESTRTVDGWTFVNGATDTIPALWGEGDAVLWAQGEPFMIVGPDGVGKTSLAQQVMRSRLAIGRRALLGLKVEPIADEGRIAYLAADRPSQAARSVRRMTTPADEPILRERLVVHRGPLPFNLVKEPPWTLRQFIQDELGATEVIVDSLKDIAFKLTDDEVGSIVNSAFQECCASGLQVLALHHQRKQQQGGSPPRTLADVYGSRWLTAGCGSVALLWGEPGDLVVNFRHLKQPAEDVGPFDVLHDHVHGRTTLHDHTDLEQLLANATAGLTAKEAAGLLFAKDDPKANEVEKARRKLESLVARNRAEKRPDAEGAVHYVAKAAR